MNLNRIPIAVEIFEQWKRARGNKIDPSTRPFSRDWETLLEDAGLRSGLEQEEACQDAQALAKEGLLKSTSVRYYPHRIARVFIPLDQEDQWKNAFGFVPVSNEDVERFRTWTWEPELNFCAQLRLMVPFEDVRQMDAFLKNGGRTRLLIPIKERSLDIFGDEKRLDELYRGSALFLDGRLTLETLRCFVVPEPLPWVRGPDPSKPLIVLENVATWDSYRRWNEQHALFGAVVYGGGDRFREGVLYLRMIFSELGGPREVFYFGDLDPAGLRIPRLASATALINGLPPVQPHAWSYCELLRLFPPGEAPQPLENNSQKEDCAWLGNLGESASCLLKAGRRLAQEHISWEFLQKIETGASIALPIQNH